MTRFHDHFRRWLGLPALALMLGLAIPLPQTAAAMRADDGAKSLAVRQMASPGKAVQPSTQTPRELASFATNRPAVADFLARHPGTWSASWDQRNDRPNLISGSGIPLVPGRGNRLVATDLGLAKGAAVGLETVVARLEAFMAKEAALLGTEGLEFVLDPKAPERVGTDPSRWSVRFMQVKDGVPVKGAYVFFRIAAGNIVQFGSMRIAPVTVDTKLAGGREAALAKAFAELGFPVGAKVREWHDRGKLALYPWAAEATPRAGEPYRGTAGAGYAHRLAWHFSFRSSADRAAWEVLVDAHSLRVLEARDARQHFTTARATGGVYAAGLRPVPNSARIVPFAYLDVDEDGETKTTDAAGEYDYAEGAASTSLSGRYVAIVDECVDPGLVADGDGNLELGNASGTDCDLPANSSSTNAARNVFHYLTLANRMTASYYPDNAWLAGTTTARVNSEEEGCNAGWEPDGTFIFGVSELDDWDEDESCGNYGEVSGIIFHEFGHGAHDEVGDGPANMATAEATGDTFALIGTHDGCLGDGANLGTAGECTGERNVVPLSVHGSHDGFIMRPSTIEDSGGPRCQFPSGLEDEYECLGDMVGAMGYWPHCEGQIAVSANWDLAQELIARHGSADGWQTMQDLWFGILQDNRAAYQVVSGGYCNTQAVVNGCGAENWYQLYLLADDDDGDLDNGTPNACRIWDAFDAHGIACGTRPPCSGEPAGIRLAFAEPPWELQQGDTHPTLEIRAWAEDGSLANYDGEVEVGLEACGTTFPLGSTTMTDGVASFTSLQRFFTPAVDLHFVASATGTHSTTGASFAVRPNPDYIMVSGFEACIP